MFEKAAKAAETALTPKSQLPYGNNGNKSFLTISCQGLPRDPHEKMDEVLENIRETSERKGGLFN